MQYGLGPEKDWTVVDFQCTSNSEIAEDGRRRLPSQRMKEKDAGSWQEIQDTLTLQFLSTLWVENQNNKPKGTKTAFPFHMELLAAEAISGEIEQQSKLFKRIGPIWKRTFLH